MFFPVNCVYWRGSTSKRLNRQIRKAGSVVGLSLDSVEKGLDTLQDQGNPVQSKPSPELRLLAPKKPREPTMLSMRCTTERLRN